MRKRMRLAAALLSALLLLCASALAEADVNARFKGIPAFELDGSTYRLNRHAETILLLGIDRDAQSTSAGGGQADFIALLVIDDAADAVTLISIDRDTMAELVTLDVLGIPSGTRVGQLCLAHALGDGGEGSLKLTKQAVTGLLNGTPIDHCIAMRMDGVAALNDALGGVEVTIEDDLTAIDPAMQKGAKLRLTGAQAEAYLRVRREAGDGTNEARMRRQSVYMKAAAKALQNKSAQDGDFIKRLFNRLEPYLTTDLPRGTVYNIANRARRYELRPFRKLEGESAAGDRGFMEFYADEDAKVRLLADVLYEKVS